jgi:hypothetical protein
LEVPCPWLEKTGEIHGLSVDLGKELAKRLDVPFEQVSYQRVADVLAGMKAGDVDFTVSNATPARAVFNVASIAAKRRNKSNPWFKRRTLFRSAVDVLRRAKAPMTAREIAEALIAGKAPQATRKQDIDLQAAILVALRKRNGGTVTGTGAPARWAFSEGNG